jgi:hypothetical protein
LTYIHCKMCYRYFVRIEMLCVFLLIETTAYLQCVTPGFFQRLCGSFLALLNYVLHSLTYREASGGFI